MRKGSTIEEALMEEDALDMEDNEDVEAMREDLESTKQLLELEVRSKKLLEKDNKRLAQELEKLKMEMCRQAGSAISGSKRVHLEKNPTYPCLRPSSLCKIFSPSQPPSKNGKLVIKSSSQKLI